MSEACSRSVIPATVAHAQEVRGCLAQSSAASIFNSARAVFSHSIYVIDAFFAGSYCCRVAANGFTVYRFKKYRFVGSAAQGDRAPPNSGSTNGRHPTWVPHINREEGGRQMTIAIRSMLARCCALLGVIGIALTMSAIGQVAAAQQTEDLWKAVQDRGVLRAGAALAPPHVMRDPKTGVQRHLRRSRQGIRSTGPGREGGVRRYDLGQHHRRHAGG